MDAPKGRYQVIEKDGRLIVIDHQAGGPLPSSIAPPRPTGPGRAADSPSGPVVSAGPGPIDRAADLLLTLAVRGWDGEGRAVIAWKWQQNHQEKRWDAALDAPQQRRLGRALLALCAAPLVPLFLIFGDGAATAIGTLLAVPLAGWGAVSLQRLVRETNDPGRAG
jgi:hypothetical protein